MGCLIRCDDALFVPPTVIPGQGREALNPESRDWLAFIFNKLGIPGSIANAKPRCGFALTIAPE
ncbi:hypothetical protein [Bradyrhizobium sp. HKCCYLR20261]|uniref:hypothetical protein n=1 Tax=Bradyrhizobium sp. HKCCYLR20261 TaxID=3420760 RepID=UPI003EB9956C